jgi:hypothetical protein
MALPVSPNSISMSEINVELTFPSTARISLNDTPVRKLLGKLSGTISMREGYGQTLLTKLPTPLVTATSGLGSITFNWGAIEGARYWYYLNGSETAQEALTNSLTITGLGNNVSRTLRVYYSKVDFINSDVSSLVTGYSQNSVTITGLTVKAGFGSLTFSWDVDPFVIYSCHLDGGTVTAAISPMVYTNLSQSQHTFTLNALKTGFASSSVSISGTPWVAKLATPVITSATNTRTQVSFAWNAVDRATSYDVTLSGGGINPITYNQTETLFTSYGTLAPGTYNISIVAKASGAISSDAATSSASIVAATISIAVLPSATNIKITVSTTGLVSPIYYRFTKYTDNSYSTVLGTPIFQSSNEFDIPGTTYSVLYFKIEAAGSTDSEFISTINASTYADPASTPIISVSNNTTGNSFTVNVTSTNATDFNLYQYIPSGGSYNLIATNKTGVFNLIGAQPSSFYYYAATAVNPGSSSGWSSLLTVETPAYVESLTIAISNLQSYSATATLNYTGPRDVTSYVIQLYEYGWSTTIPILEFRSTTNVISITDLQPTYKYYIRAIAGGYIVEPSESNTFTTPVYVPPLTAPSTLQLSVVYDYNNGTSTLTLSAGYGDAPTNYYLFSTGNNYNNLAYYSTNTTGVFVVPMNSGFFTGYGSNSVGTSPYFSNIVYG